MKRYLSGNPFHLIHVAKSYGGIDMKRIHIFILFLTKSILLLPLAIIEYVFSGKKIANTEIKQSPVFILGHNRSGTTYLHKLLVKDPQFGYCRNTDMLFPYIKTPFNNILSTGMQRFFSLLDVKSFAYRDTNLILSDPQEEDMCMTALFMPASSYWGFVFPKYALLNFHRFIYFLSDADRKNWKSQYLYFLKKITIKNAGNKILFSKFLFIHRDPKRVFYSTKRIWQHAMDQLGMQITDDATINQNIVTHYKKMHEFYESDKTFLSDEELCEISYDELKKSPVSTLRKVYEHLQLGDFSSVEPHFTSQLKKERSYQTFSYHYDEATDAMIHTKLQEYFIKWNY